MSFHVLMAKAERSSRKVPHNIDLTEKNSVVMVRTDGLRGKKANQV